MTPQEHLTSAEEWMLQASKETTKDDIAVALAFANTHAQVGMLAQSVQDSDAVVGQMNASLQSVRNALTRKQAEGR